MSEYRAYSKIWRSKPYQLTFSFLVALLTTQLTTYLNLDCSNGFMFYRLLYTLWKILSIGLKQLQTALRIIDALLFLIDCKQMLYPFYELVEWCNTLVVLKFTRKFTKSYNVLWKKFVIGTKIAKKFKAVLHL